MKYYDAVVKLHLVKIKDLHNDVRQLIKDTTNNKLSNSFINENVKTDSNTTSDESNLRSRATKFAKDKAKEIAEEVSTGYINRSNIPKEGKEILNRMLKNYSEFRSNISSLNGKIPEDKQYTDPNIMNLRDRFSCSYLTSINTNLTDSINFKDRATIVSTWNRRIKPGSIWQFNLTQHFGKGIHLNYLYDIENLNKDHPVGYIFILEYFGDKRFKITRSETQDAFTGYSPVKLRCQFYHRINYLAKETDDSINDIPIVYKHKRQKRDFVEGSTFDNYFSPRREYYMHVPIDEIDLLIGM